jgi:hypothetical protein
LHSSDTGKNLEYNETVYKLFIGFMKSYESVRREVLYSIIIEFEIPTHLVTLIKMCLNETFRKVCMGSYLSDMYPIPNGVTEGDYLLPFLFMFASEYARRKV